MELLGKIKVISASEQKGSLTIRYMVLTTNDQYPQTIKIDFINDKCSLLDAVNIGDDVSVSINLRGREWEDTKNLEIKYFNQIQGWKIEKK